MVAKLSAFLAAAAVLGGAAFVFLGVGPHPLAPSDVWVEGNLLCNGRNGTDPCVRTISEGVRLVDNSGTVHVLAFDGTYMEDGVVIAKPLTLRAEDPNVELLGQSTNGTVVDVLAGGVTIEGMVFSHAFNTPGMTGVAATKLQGVILRGIKAFDLETGVRALEVQDMTLEASEITGSHANGVEVLGSMDFTIGGSGNNVSDNEGRGIWVDGSHIGTIADNMITGNGLTGLNVSYSQDITVRNNTIENNGANGVIVSTSVGPGPGPLQPNGGGARFWVTDPTAVEHNLIKSNHDFGIEIAGAGSFGFSLRSNTISLTQGSGLVLAEGAHSVSIDGGTVDSNTGWGVLGMMVMDISVRNLMVTNNGPSPVPITRSSGPAPIPLQGGGGGARFWVTDPSEIRGSTFRGNNGPAIELANSTDFVLADNTIETDGGYEGIVLEGSVGVGVIGNHVRSADVGQGVGASLLLSQLVQVMGNTFEDLSTGVLIDGGCHLHLAFNAFINDVTNITVQGTPCDLTFGNATLRFTPRTLNLRSQGSYVTLHFRVTGLDPSLFDLASLTYDVNGVMLTPPAGSPSKVTVGNGTIEAMVKLDRSEVIAAFGASGTYVVTVMGDMWSASDTVDAILP